MFYLPIFPRGSWRVRPVGPPSEQYTKRWFESTELKLQNYTVVNEPRDIRQVTAIYLAAACKVLGIGLGVVLFLMAIGDATGLLFSIAKFNEKLRAFGIDALMAVAGAGFLYWILVAKRPRRFERIFYE